MGTRNRIYMLTKFLGRGLAVPYVAGLALTYLFRRLIRNYDRERHHLKQASLRQGFRMAANWLPYRQPRWAIVAPGQRGFAFPAFWMPRRRL